MDKLITLYLLLAVVRMQFWQNGGQTNNPQKGPKVDKRITLRHCIYIYIYMRHIWRGVMERGVFAFACQYIVSPRGRTGNRTVTQMRHPFLVEGRPNCTRQSLASTVSAPRVAATSYCDPGHQANVITPCLLTPCLNVPNFTFRKRKRQKSPGFHV